MSKRQILVWLIGFSLITLSILFSLSETAFINKPANIEHADKVLVRKQQRMGLDRWLYRGIQ
jgi:hypothetical protein